MLCDVVACSHEHFLVMVVIGRLKVPTSVLGTASAIDAPLLVVARTVAVCGLLIFVSN